ncbi:DUF4153 domain-containing protein [Paenibacillus sp. WLX2291]|uniref:DUF4153 domain-containing protein n=1 Tax=Paenibacillus sp. WLX2291 TaxID=3296934 RepID=UPI0039841052
MYEKLIVTPQRAGIVLGTAFALAAIHQYLFYDHTYGISYPMFVILFYLYMYIYAGDCLRRGSWFSRLFTTVIILLSLTYGWFANGFFYVLNMLVVPGLISLHMAYMLSYRRPNWARMYIVYAALEHVLLQLPAHLPTPLRMLYRKAAGRMQQQHKRIAGKILLGLLCALPLLIIIIGLLSSADGMFQQMLIHVPDWLPRLSFTEGTLRLVWIVMMGFILFAYVWGFIQPYRRQSLSSSLVADQPASDSAAGATIPSASPAHDWHIDQPNAAYPPLVMPRLDPIMLATVLVVINLVYLLFVSLQFSYLFGAGQGYLPDGSTYAEYARSGFGELVLVTGLNFVILLSALYGSVKAGVGLHRLNQFLLLILVVCSAVMLCSAFMRLLMYEQAYGYTVIRFLVHAFMLFLGVLLVLAGLRIYMSRLPLIHCYIVFGLISYVLVNYIGMDRIIAERNIQRYEQTGELDQDYLLTLSPGAIPMLLRFSYEHQLPELRKRLHTDNEYVVTRHASWQEYNWETHRAIQQLRLDRPL